MMRTNKLSMLGYSLLFAAAFWCVGWLGIGAYFCHPNAEDFSLCVIPRDQGILYSIINLLTTYDGRYFTNLLHAINPLAFNWLAGYKLMPIVGILLLLLAVWFFLETLFHSPSSKFLLLFSLLFTCIHFALAPSLPHDLYWMVSSFVYIYPWTFTLLWIGAYIRYVYAKNHRAELLWFCVTAIALICCIGMNEMFLVTNSVLLLVLLIWSWHSGQREFKHTLPLAIIGVSCILFFVTCPGISFRISQNVPEGKSFVNRNNLVQSVSDYIITLFGFLKSGLVFCAFALTILHIDKFSFRYDFGVKITTVKTHLCLVAALFCIGYLMT